MATFQKIFEMNKDGWILYHSKNCGYCLDIKKNVGIIKWMLMNKRECSDGQCPPEILGYPTWLNTRTGAMWDGMGVFR
jgi:hypothetical protein